MDKEKGVMPSVIYKRVTCRACGCGNLELIFSLRPTPIGDAYITSDNLNDPQPSYPIDLHMCADCGLAQLMDVIDPKVLYGDYLYITASSVTLADHFQEYAERVIGRCNLIPRSLVIDIGSNDGTLLRYFQIGGMSVLGVEPSPQIAAQASANGIKTISEFFSVATARNIVADYGKAKLITANNVFANIDDLQDWVEAIKIVLAKDGVFVFESYYLADVVKNMVFDFIYHEHLSAFSIKPIQALFNRMGLELFAVERVSTKGGSLRYFIQWGDGPLFKDGSVDLLRAQEEEMGLYDKEIYNKFSQKISVLKRDVCLTLARLKKEGKTIAGFGASITGTTLIYHFELGEYLDYLLDDNPAKQGKYSPGLHLPVYPAEEMYWRKPDYIVILAWRFAKIVIGKNSRYLNEGGSFLVPVPDLSIINSV